MNDLAASLEKKERFFMPAIAKENLVIRVLLVEDSSADLLLTERLLQLNQSRSFQIKSVQRLADGLQELNSHPYDVVLLDLSLPDSDGLKGLESVLRSKPHTPVVVLTGASDEQLGVEAVRMGAEDYLMKSEIKADILSRSLIFALERSAKKQRSFPETHAFSLEDIEVDLERQIVFQRTSEGKDPISLTPIQFRILLFLLRHKGKTVSRTEIAHEVWGSSATEINVRTVDRHICALKKKCPRIDAMIDAIYGIGYRLES